MLGREGPPCHGMPLHDQCIHLLAGGGGCAGSSAAMHPSSRGGGGVSDLVYIAGC